MTEQQLKFCPLINNTCRKDCIAYIKGFTSAATEYIGMGKSKEVEIVIEPECKHYDRLTKGVDKS